MISNLDRITIEMIRGRLETITRQMGITLVQKARSYALRESCDCSTAIFDFEGRLVEQWPQNPSHLLGIKCSVKEALRQFSSDLHDQDVIIVNDPYRGGTHLPDMTMLVPNGEYVLFPAVRAHHSDIDGPHPGGMYPLAHEIYQEGDIIPPVRLAEGGKIRRGMDIMERLLKNNRLPDVYEADLNAMLVANNAGRVGITELVHDYGVKVLARSIDYILDYTENLTRLEIEKWPNGTYDGHSYCDTDFQGNTDVMVKASVIITGNQLKIDFAGSTPQVLGFINSPIANTKTYAIIPVLCSIEPAIPINDGLLRVIEIIAPEGSAVNPSFPAPTGLCSFHLGAQISEAVARALAQAVPTKIGVTWANLPHVLIEGGRMREEHYFFHQALLTVGGCGACYGCDGWGLPSPLRSKLPSVEMLEAKSPYFIEQRELTIDSGGAGKWRGGLGARVIIKITSPGKVTAFTQGIKWPAAGFFGASRGSLNAIALKYDSLQETKVSPMIYRQEVVPMDKIYIEQGGGGGWGNPLARAPELVREDVIDEYVSIEGAERDYGVVIDPATLEVNYELTAARRSEKSQKK